MSKTKEELSEIEDDKLAHEYAKKDAKIIMMKDQFKHGYNDPVLFCMCGDDVDVEIKMNMSPSAILEDWNGNCSNCGRIWTIRCSESHPEGGG